MQFQLSAIDPIVTHIVFVEEFHKLIDRFQSRKGLCTIFAMLGQSLPAVLGQFFLSGTHSSARRELN
jgi:hypothetical protein